MCMAYFYGYEIIQFLPGRSAKKSIARVISAVRLAVGDVGCGPAISR